MSKTLKTINQYVSDSKPTDHKNVSYNFYMEMLANISNTYIEEKENLKQEVLKIQDEQLRLKILELL